MQGDYVEKIPGRKESARLMVAKKMKVGIGMELYMFVMLWFHGRPPRHKTKFTLIQSGTIYVY